MIYRGSLESGAEFSSCGTYRYTLWRRWEVGKFAAFIMLNPSTATESKPDPTITRCMNFAKTWGFGGLIVANLFALRSTDPRALKTHTDPIGPENDTVLMYLAAAEDLVGKTVCAWGNHGSISGRSLKVLEMLHGADLSCLGVTKKCEPVHPLYQPSTAELITYSRDRSDK